MRINARGSGSTPHEGFVEEVIRMGSYDKHLDATSAARESRMRGGSVVDGSS